MIFCTNCGNALKEVVRFCSKCGAAAEIGGQAASSPGTPPADGGQKGRDGKLQVEGKKKRGKGGKAAITIVIILLLVGGVTALYGYSHGFDKLPLIGAYFAVDGGEEEGELDAATESAVPTETVTTDESGQTGSKEAEKPPYINAAVGDIIEFGGHEWRVLELRDGRALLLSEYLPESRSYHETGENATWADSNLRQYLNEQFYEGFAETEREWIHDTLLTNNSNPWYGTSGGQHTTDKVFILSLEEVVEYMGDSGQVQNKSHPNNEEWGVEDEYSDGRIAHKADGATSWWWLRSPGADPSCAVGVDPSGRLNIHGTDAGWEEGGIRPALWLTNDADGDNDTPSEMRVAPITVIDWQAMYRQFIDDYDEEEKQVFDMFLYDMNDDGIPELFFGLYRYLDVYTLVDAEVMHIGNIFNEAYLLEGYPGIYTYGGYGTGVGGSVYYEMIGNEIVPSGGAEVVSLEHSLDDMAPPETPRYALFNGEDVTEEEYWSIREYYFNENTSMKYYPYRVWGDEETDNVELMFNEYLTETR